MMIKINKSFISIPRDRPVHGDIIMSAENTSYILMAISGTTAIICFGFAFYFSQKENDD